MKQLINIPRLFIEIVAAIAVVESAVMCILPLVAPGLHGFNEAVLDAAMLSILSGPFVLWRVLHSARRAASVNANAQVACTPRWMLAGVATILFVGLAITGLATFKSACDVQHLARQDFDLLTQRLTSDIGRQVNQTVYGLKGLRGVYLASKSVERGGFRAAVASRDLAKEFPGALGLGFIQRVMRTELPEFMAAARADEAPEFAIHTWPHPEGGASPGSVESADLPDLYVVKHIFPLERNRAAWGLDIGSEPVRRAAAELAVRTGEPTISGRITLVQDEHTHAGFLYLVPVYKNGTHPTTPAEREAALVGLVYVPIDLNEVLGGDAEAGLMKREPTALASGSLDAMNANTKLATGAYGSNKGLSLFGHAYEGLLDLEIFDGVETTKANEMFDLDRHLDHEVGTIGDDAFVERMFFNRVIVPVGGRSWTIITSTTPKFEATIDHSMTAITGVGGTILSLLMAAIVWSLGMARTRALKLALSMTSDLTGAKNVAEVSLREAEALRATLDMHNIVSVADAMGRITYANNSFCRISGYTLAELIGQNHRIVNSGMHSEAFWTNVWKTISGGSPWHGEICNRAKDGSLYWMDSIIAPFKGTDGKIEKYVSIRTEITKRKTAESQLLLNNAELKQARSDAETANRAKSEFLANMSHEIRTPLTAILGFTDLLYEDGNMALAQRMHTIDTIKNAGTHLLTVINDILDLSKIEADMMTIERIDTPLVSVLREVESLIRPRAAGKGVTLNAVLMSPVPEHIHCDPTRLRQILMNLAGNSAKFTEAGFVTMSAGTEDQDGHSRLVIDIEDTGPGMTPDQAQRLFAAFGQGDSTITRKHGGTGLGLNICLRLANMMGGDVTLLRTELGKGSCFRLALPLDAVAGSAMVTRLEAMQEPNADKPAAVMICLSGRILLAEDGLDNQRLIAFHLKKAGATVEVADNGLIALEMLDKAEAAGTPYDLLLTDMQMPEMDGYTLARTLRDRGSTLPIVALTAHAMAEDRDKCISAGCDDYASKPIDKPKLLEACAASMNKRVGVIATKIKMNHGLNSECFSHGPVHCQ